MYVFDKMSNNTVIFNFKQTSLKLKFSFFNKKTLRATILPLIIEAWFVKNVSYLYLKEVIY